MFPEADYSRTGIFRQGDQEMKKSIHWFVLAIGFLIAGCGQDRIADPSQPAADQPLTVEPDSTIVPTPPTLVAPPTSQSIVQESKTEADESFDHEIVLFDGKDLGQWKPAAYVESGKVHLQDGAVYLEKGNDMTGIVWTGPLLRMNYELTLEAMRVKGEDFFCGLTFPYGQNPCTLICGGWGGTLVGLSNIDYYDAANNQTGTSMSFENGKWYPIRVKVTPAKIEAWIDDKRMIDFETADHKIGIRFEMELCKPLGIATWRTTGAMRNMKMTPIIP